MSTGTRDGSNPKRNEVSPAAGESHEQAPTSAVGAPLTRRTALGAGAGALVAGASGLGDGASGSLADAVPEPSEHDLLAEYGARLTRSILENYERGSKAHYGAYTRALEHSGLADARLAVEEGVLSTARTFCAAEVLCLEADPEYPMIVKMISIPGKDIGVPNADCNYQQATIHGDHTYRIFGNRGSAKLFDIHVQSGSPADMKNFRVTTSLGAMGYDIPKDEEFEIVLSREKHDGYWLELPDGLVTLFIRQTFNDWDTENPAMLMIERVGASYPPPRLSSSSEVFEKRVQMMNAYLGEVIDAMQRIVFNHLKGGANSIQHVPGPESGSSVYKFLWGNYVCQTDEAVVLEYKMPRTVYTGIHLGNLQGDGAQYHLRHVSLNGHQGKPDSDGIYRVVISHRDPGVKNWLDAAGRVFGMMLVRFYDPDEVPVPTMQVVPFDKVRDYLPDDTAHVTPEERQEIMRRRLVSVHRRLMTDY